MYMFVVSISIDNDSDDDHNKTIRRVFDMIHIIIISSRRWLQTDVWQQTSSSLSCIDFRAAANVGENLHQQRVRLPAVDNMRRLHAIRER